MGPVAPGDSVVFLVGNFAAQHNGAVITCDSAVRYSDMRIEFFGNVLINKNTTYIYGDRAEYDGDLNEARVYSDIVKVIDGDATLYTYDFRFNTKTNVGAVRPGRRAHEPRESARGGPRLLLCRCEGAGGAWSGWRCATTSTNSGATRWSITWPPTTPLFYERTNIWNTRRRLPLCRPRRPTRSSTTLYIGHPQRLRADRKAGDVERQHRLLPSAQPRDLAAATCRSTTRSTRCWPSAITANTGRSRAMRC